MSCWMIPTITVVSATTFRIDAHAKAIQNTLKALPFPATGLLIATSRPTFKFEGEFQEIPKKWLGSGKWGRTEYSWFVLLGLNEFINTDYCLTVQWDGYALNPDKWTNEFLECDYIGSPWPRRFGLVRVGNGGFSLRSKKWLESFARVRLKPTNESFDFRRDFLEDRHACVSCSEFCKQMGLRVASLPLAARWGIEYQVEEYPYARSADTFGFHAAWVPGNAEHLLT